MPDMSHQLWDPSSLGGESNGTHKRQRLYLCRRDFEKAQEFSSSEDDKFDWDELIGVSERSILKVVQLAALARRFVPRRIPIHNLWYQSAEMIVQKAKTTLQQTEQVVTDRLHGMLLGALLGKPVMFYDNSYGKLSRYYKRWLQGSPIIKLANDE